jgi:hypothetical protein
MLLGRRCFQSTKRYFSIVSNLIISVFLTEIAYTLMKDFTAIDASALIADTVQSNPMKGNNLRVILYFH